MIEYRNQEDGKLYETYNDNYFLNCCPKCGKDLFRNSYKSLEVCNIKSREDISISIKMEYCKKCDELYIFST